MIEAGSSEISPRMPSSRDCAYGSRYTEYCISVVHVCSTSCTKLHRQSFSIAQCHFPVARCLFRLLWQSFPFALNFYDCSLPFPIALAVVSDCSVTFSDSSAPFSDCSVPFSNFSAFFSNFSSRCFRLLNKLFFMLIHLCKSNYTMPSQIHTF